MVSQISKEDAFVLLDKFMEETTPIWAQLVPRNQVHVIANVDGILTRTPDGLMCVRSMKRNAEPYISFRPELATLFAYGDSRVMPQPLGEGFPLIESILVLSFSDVFSVMLCEVATDAQVPDDTRL